MMRCQAKTKNGERCRNQAREGEELCPHPARAWRDLSTPTSRSLAGIGITSTRYRLARRLQLGANV